MPIDIRSARLERGLRQSDLADAVGVSGHKIRKWERGLELPSDAEFGKLARGLGISKKTLAAAQRAHMRRVTPGEGYTTATTNRRELIHAQDRAPKDKLRVLDLFGGCGGLSYGLEWSDRFATVGGIDLLPDRIKSFSTNHPTASAIVADIRTLDLAEIRRQCGRVDLVVGGPPCQGFSSIRPFRTLTEGDRRNSLVEHFILLVSELKPRWLVFENVVGVLTHAGASMLESILSGFEEAGYKTTMRVVNAALYGVPQNRERLIVVGNRRGITFSWPEPTHQVEHKSMAGSRSEVIRTDLLFSQHLPRAVTVGEAISDLAPVESGCEKNEYISKPRNAYQALMREGLTRTTLHRSTRHSKKMLEIIRHSGPNISCIPKHLITSGFSSCYSRLDADKPGTTLTVNFVHPASNRCIHPSQNRALTIREGARLQGFPDRFEFRGTVAQIVKQIGNAVPPLLARALGEAIYKADRS